MSIIIRLQNLPWSANSMDIRHYFGGLVIPDGGVHIVGGEKGDAFIAFATDEDARQAMERDGGKIKDVRVKLLLSSRNEMQRIIDIARNQTMIAAQGSQGSLGSQGMGGGGGSTKSKKVSNSPDRRRSRSPDRRRDRDRDRDKGSSSSKKSKRKSRSKSRSPSRRTHRNRRDRSSDRSSNKEAKHVEEKVVKKDESSRSSLDNNSVETEKQAAAAAAVAEFLSLPPLPENPIPPVPLPPAPTPDLTVLAPRIANMGFPPLFPIVGAAGATMNMPPGMNMNMPMPMTMAMSMTPMSMPVTLPSDQFGPRLMQHTDSFDNRDPPVWQNPSSIPFSLPVMHMNPPPGPPGPLPGDPSNNLLVHNNNNNRMDPRISMLPNIPLPPIHREESSDSSPASQPNRLSMNEPNPFDPRRNGNRDDAPPPMMSRSSDNGGGRRGESRFRGYAVEMRNMPYTITYREVREFLKGCQMPPDGLTLVEINGRRTGVGYALLNGDRDVQEALRKNKNYMLNRRVEVRRCDEDDFMDAWENAENRFRKIPKTTDDLVIVLKGIPFSSTEKDIVQFLNGLEVSDVVVQYDQTRKTVGTGYARFATYDDYKIALTFNGKPLQHRFVEILPSTIEKMYEASKYSPAPMRRPQFPKTTPLNEDLMNNIRASNKTFAVALRGLPPNVVDSDIVAFFSRVNVDPLAVHIMVNPNGLPSGDAFAEFSNVLDLENALKQDGELIGGRVVRINPIAMEQMHEILGRPSFPGRGVMDRGPFMGRGGIDPEFDLERRPPFMPDPDMDLDPDMEANGLPYFAGPPNFGRPRGPGPMGPIGGGPGGPGGPMGGGPSFSMMGQPRFRPMMRPQVPDNFGKPGCVVAARNISFRATDTDLLDFFKDYNIKHSNIIRRFDNMGQITGEARIDFNTPEDAVRAVAEFGGQLFLGRNIILSKPS